MLEFGQKSAAPAGVPVRDVTEAEFMTEVIEASREVPVVVDFWAPWCGPCKTLGPQLEAAVAAAKGRVRMVKVNIDENQMIAGQLRIQSIPTVYGFWQGKPVDGFQGAVSGAEVRAFVDRLAGLAGDGGLGEALAAAEAMLAEGAAADAAETFAAILAEEPENAAAYGGLARAQLALARQAENAGPVAELLDRVLASPGDHQARFELALALHAAGKVEGAVEELLEIVRRNAAWNEGAAKAQLFIIFEALKPNDPIALKGRRRLSSMLFA